MTSLTTSATTDDSLAGKRALDALAEVFIHLGDMANVNTNQLLIVSGRLDPLALEQSVQRAVAQIPLLRYRPHGGQLRPFDTSTTRWVKHLEYAAPCDFNDAAFRRLLMNFSSEHRLRWRERPPLQLLLVTGNGGHNSCVYLSSHHGVADARSDCLLLRAIIGHYAHITGVPGATAPGGELPFAPLAEIRPGWFRPRVRGHRWLRALGSVVADLLHRDIGFTVQLQGQRWEGMAADPDIGQLDFFHSLLPRELEARLGPAAKSAGVTINTLLCAALARLMESTGSHHRGTLRITCAISLRRLIEHHHDRSFRNYLVPSGIRLRTGQQTPSLLHNLHTAICRARSDRQIGTELGRLEILLPLLRLRSLRGPARHLLNLCQGTNACYSNPGRIEEDFSSFGSSEHRTQSYLGFGCLVPPYDFILYTPTVNGRMQLDLVYRRAAFRDIHREFAAPYLDALRHLLEELQSPPRR
ncbi:hypothetical protein [Microbulbifer thermotolerans]|uniref:hypothetical protein n=1 Tax=Microbulbifer thermotolerans TaxID=252514 RepID=UPI00224B45D2|nr:hypothetical protein [Microbulbifer thermotolerans]MCX2778283.1 hypothetical protein [Microbulbifer thermotolerans]MCX2804322.1 hypothetical protein [Microbulbifer thermotolerans]